MIKILTCFSVVNDTDDVTRTDWEKASDQNFIIDYTNQMINPYDEAAIEYALKYKEAAARCGIMAHITAVSVGQSLEEAIFRNLFAVGIDRIVLLRNNAQIAFDPDSVSKILKDFIKGDNYDSIFLGQQNSITCNGQTGARLSVYLGLPLISYISDIQFTKDKLHVICKTRFGFQSAIVEPGGVFCFYNAQHPYLRVATLREKLKVSEKQIEEYMVETDEKQEDELSLVSLSYQPMVRKCKLITGDSTKEKAHLLLEHYLHCRGV
jgi:electron transfer flavoprotein alpha/beta subunit